MGEAATLQHYGEVAISLVETETLCQDVTNLLNKANRQGQLDNNVVRDLQKVGRVLFDQLLAPEVKETVRTTEETFLLFSLDEQLVQIPWELLHDGTHFLCLRFACGRSVKTRSSFFGGKLGGRQPPTKMLTLADPTGDLSAAYREGVRLRNELERRGRSINVHLKTTDIDAQFTKKNIRDYDIVHFSGHANYIPEDPSQSGWLLNNSKLTAKDVLALGSGGHFPSVVFSNACQSGQTKEWRVEKDFENRVFGLGNAFLAAGANHYIGTFWQILDEPAAMFAEMFYKNLTKGTAIGEALRLSRHALIDKHGESSIVWASYMLYGDPAVGLWTETNKIASGNGRQPKKSHKTISTIVGVLLAVGIGIAVFIRHRHQQYRAEAIDAISDMVMKGQDYLSAVAVFPFRNLTNNEESNWLGSAISEGLVTMLATAPGWTLIERNKMRELIEKYGPVDEASALDVGKEYGLDAIVTGSFQNVSGKVKIDARLVKVSEGEIIGTASAVGPTEELYRLQDQIAHYLIAAVKEKLREDIDFRVRLKKARTMVDATEKAAGAENKGSRANVQASEMASKAYDIYMGDQFKLALKFSEKALEEDPENPTALFVSGDIFRWHGRWDEALSRFEKLRDVAVRTNDAESLGKAYDYIGLILDRKGNYQEARLSYDQAMEIYQRSGNKYGVGDVHVSLGHWYLDRGDTDAAEQHFKEYLKVSKEERGTPGDLMYAYFALGILYEQKGEYEDAIAHYEKYVDMARDLDHPWELAQGRLYLGYVLAEKGNLERAQREVDEAVEILEGLTDSVDITRDKNMGRLVSGIIMYKKGEYGKALEQISEGIATAEEYGPTELVEFRVWKARILEKIGRGQEAIEEFDAAYEILKQLGSENRRIAKEVVHDRQILVGTAK